MNDITKYNMKEVKTLLQFIIDNESTPLQILVQDTNYNKVSLLETLHFIKCRITKEVEVGLCDLKGRLSQFNINKDKDKDTNKDIILFYADKNRDVNNYNECLELLYNYYSYTHKNINPLTISIAEFKESIPSEVYYYKENGKVIWASFIEENEVAYIASDFNLNIDITLREQLINELLLILFSKYNTITFEADNTCVEMTFLLNRFNYQNNVNTYYTYLLENLKGEKND